ncbi:unnamed protein product [Didymodactylos carnosus]|uniref:Flavoprotein domain-containing protein n=1 Tax=Didymodactylos carnosus TaxID=1234261 RepID=A0A8S2DGR7_9BILA|nr:unnamed protein product [Didymodactylos carnosus]CAF3681945.1 unnamed protein product [Didymodactylos carnosus]
MDTCSRRLNLLLGVTGSVAAIKVSELVQLFNDKNFNIIIIPTKASQYFMKLDEQSNIQHGIINDLTANKNEVKNLYFLDEDEWLTWHERNDPILHIELRNWADICLIAPLDANTLAKLSNGLCDNLLTNVVRAWDIRNKLVFLAPAMNTYMYEHPLTRKQLDILKTFGYIEIESIEKTLMCGQKGLGAMSSTQTIVDTIISRLAERT